MEYNYFKIGDIKKGNYEFIEMFEIMNSKYTGMLKDTVVEINFVQNAGYVYSDRSIRNYILKYAYARENEPHIFIKKTDDAIDIPKRQYGIKNIFVNQAIAILKNDALDRDQLIDQIIKKM